MGTKLNDDSVKETENQETKENTSKKDSEKSAIEEAIDKKIADMKKDEDGDSKEAENKNSKEDTTDIIKDSKKEDEESDKKEESDKIKDSGNSEENSDKKEEDSDKRDEESDKKEDDSDKKDNKTSSLADEVPGLVIQTPYIDSSVAKSKHKKKVRLVVLSTILAALIIAYVAGVIYYSKYFNSNTYLNGYDISGKTVEEVETMLNDMVFSGYNLEIQFKNDTQILNVGDGNMYVEPATPISVYKNKQNPFLWLFNINAENKYFVDYRVCYDEEVLSAYINTFDVMKTENMTPSIDAYVKFEEGEAVIVPDITGTVLDKELVLVAVKEALDSMSSFVNIDEKMCYIPADIRSDSPSVLEAYDNAVDYLSIEASFEFCEDYTYTLTTEELALMAYIDDNGEVQISKTNVKMFVEDFADRFTTVQEDRKFVTHNGDLILVEGGKWYGWVINAEEEFEEFYNLIITKKSFTKEPVCDRRGYSYSEINDIGDSYVEIDLTQQHVYVYIDGELETHSRCVTGDESSGHGTPGGVYSITYMALDVVLTGADYESPVTFWMPFNGGIGLHDATWRYSFEDDTYLYDGSHDCVNLPWENARDIFYLVESGMPVICYWEDEVTFLEEE